MKLLLVDGHNVLFRAYSVPFRFYSPQGTPLHVVTAFLSLVRRAITAVELAAGDGVIIVFDTPQPTANHELWGTYKANRVQDYATLEDSPIHHLPHIQQALLATGVCTFELPGFEADDVVGHLCQHALNDCKQVFILSNDSDFYQLLQTDVAIVKLLSRQGHAIMRQADIEAQLGIPIHQYVRYKALIGDKADNIDGIPGVGPATARAIILGKKPEPSGYGELIARNMQLITLHQKFELPILQPADRWHLLLDPNQRIFERAGL